MAETKRPNSMLFVVGFILLAAGLAYFIRGGGGPLTCGGELRPPKPEKRDGIVSDMPRFGGYTCVGGKWHVKYDGMFGESVTPYKKR